MLKYPQGMLSVSEDDCTLGESVITESFPCLTAEPGVRELIGVPFEATASINRFFLRHLVLRHFVDVVRG